MKTKSLLGLVVLLFGSATLAPALAEQRPCSLAQEGDSLEQALTRCETAASLGDTEAAFELATFFARDTQGYRDYTQSVDWLRQAAEAGHREAAYNLGVAIQYGKGVAADPNRAVTWYLKAAELGSAKAERNLGILYERGEGLPKDPQQAFVWTEKAAKQGLPESQLKLGLMMLEGSGTAVDRVQALAWIKLAAEGGDPNAQFMMGMLQADLDPKLAVSWYHKAAMQDHVFAMHNLAVAYFQGVGVEQDLDLALHWVEASIAIGNEQGAALKTRILETRGDTPEPQRLQGFGLRRELLAPAEADQEPLSETAPSATAAAQASPRLAGTQEQEQEQEPDRQALALVTPSPMDQGQTPKVQDRASEDKTSSAPDGAASRSADEFARTQPEEEASSPVTSALPEQQTPAEPQEMEASVVARPADSVPAPSVSTEQEADRLPAEAEAEAEAEAAAEAEAEAETSLATAAEQVAEAQRFEVPAGATTLETKAALNEPPALTAASDRDASVAAQSDAITGAAKANIAQEASAKETIKKDVLTKETEATRTESSFKAAEDNPTLVATTNVAQVDEVGSADAQVLDARAVDSAQTTTQPEVAVPEIRHPAWRDGRWLLARPAEHYLIQLARTSRASGIHAYIRRHRLGDQARYYQIPELNKVAFVLIYGSYASLAQAKQALASLPAAVRGDGAWVRTYASLQEQYQRRP